MFPYTFKNRLANIRRQRGPPRGMLTFPIHLARYGIQSFRTGLSIVLNRLLAKQPWLSEDASKVCRHHNMILLLLFQKVRLKTGSDKAVKA